MSNMDAVTKQEWGYHFNAQRAEDVKSNYINIGANTYPLDGGIWGIRGYTSSMDKTVSNIQERIKTGKFNRGEDKKFLNKVLKRLAYHAYGFSEQAKEFGDNMAAKAAFDIAAKILPFEEYQKTFEKRLGPNGEMKVTEADLKEIE
jgi:hypothetical protein